RIFALDAASGDIQWNFEGGVETTGLLGAASPAVGGGTVVVPFTNGEVYALRAANGQEAWSEQLTRRRVYSALTSLSDINAFPVIAPGIVHAAMYSGRRMAIDLRSCGRLWDQEISTLQPPWFAGDFLQVLTTAWDLLCQTHRNRLIRCVPSHGKY